MIREFGGRFGSTQTPDLIPKEDQRSEVQRQIDEYLASGGKIQTVPFGVGCETPGEGRPMSHAETKRYNFQINTRKREIRNG